MTDKLRAKKKEQLISALRANQYNISDACESVNIDRKTFYNWKDRDEEFAQRVEEVAERTTDTVVSALFRNAIEGNVTAQIFWLKNKREDVWSDKKQVEHSGLINNPMELTEEQEKREAEILGLEPDDE